MSKPHLVIWNATAVTGVATFRSAVITAARGSANFDYGVTVEFTSTAAGTLSLEVNERGVQGYNIDVAAAGTEDTNTNAWVQRDLSPTATIAIVAGATCTLVVKRRWTRWRLKYANTSGTGTVTARVSFP